MGESAKYAEWLERLEHVALEPVPEPMLVVLCARCGFQVELPGAEARAAFAAHDCPFPPPALRAPALAADEASGVRVEAA